MRTGAWRWYSYGPVETETSELWMRTWHFNGKKFKKNERVILVIRKTVQEWITLTDWDWKAWKMNNPNYWKIRKWLDLSGKVLYINLYEPQIKIISTLSNNPAKLMLHLRDGSVPKEVSL